MINAYETGFILVRLAFFAGPCRPISGLIAIACIRLYLWVHS
jgi:hypothetical protein